ncbi:hypothetical protein XA3_20330 [Xylocopilactobacillus apicola]|uniref:Ribose-5-phosphate isomerase A n=1 Tax=Xylocopilactobacillus apicola TaxID=2932184 RepID=A0AAU9DQW8_9LACO|nr:hypothetical protein XA3_20330 [Xylocopilactobacillus apicola]
MDFQSEPGRFFLNDPSGKMLAEIKYIESDNVLDVVHTFVDSSLRGQGIAGKLLEQVVMKARESGAMIKPSCSFAKAAFATNPEYQKLQYRGDEALIAQEKKNAGKRAAEFVEDQMTVGLGTGSTVFYLVEALAKRVKNETLNITAVATSSRTAELAQKLGITVKSLDEVDHLDLTIDGADEIDANFQGIKGGGGAQTLEKIVACASSKNIWIVDEFKMVYKLGNFGLPLEVIPFGSKELFARLKREGLKPAWRLDENKEHVLTHNHNYLIDLRLGLIEHPHLLANWLDHQVGIVEHGLFLDVVDTVVVGKSEKTEVIPAIRR